MLKTDYFQGVLDFETPTFLSLSFHKTSLFCAVAQCPVCDRHERLHLLDPQSYVLFERAMPSDHPGKFSS